MCRESMVPAARASRWNRTKTSSSMSLETISLIATREPVPLWTASNTVPMPPWPMSSVMRYLSPMT